MDAFSVSGVETTATTPNTMTTPTHDESRTDDTSPSAGWKTVYDRLDVPTTVHDDTPTPVIVADGGAPRTGTVARRLGVDGEQLLRYVQTHPDPDVESLQAAFDFNDEHETLVERWLVRVTGGDAL